MKRMPALFVGHGSPMNAIEENEFVAEWKALWSRIPRPTAILAISAHWYTDGTRVTDSEAPATVYDMYGFPDALYKIVYGAKGSPHFAQLTQSMLSCEVAVDNSWGFDHGAWSVLHRIYPDADIPLFQLSIDRNAQLSDYYKIGQELKGLREQGVLIFGSGNVVHNLARINWNISVGYPWAETFDAYIKQNVLNRNDDDVINYQNVGAVSSLSFTTLEHFAPLLFILGATDKDEKVEVFNDSCILGSLSMTSYLIG